MKWQTFDNLTRVEQTLFGLSWVVATMVIACLSVQRSFLDIAPFEWLAIVVAFAAARSAGMAFNAWIDRESDAQNPRTEGRALPSGQATTYQVLGLGVGGIALFVVACASINTACLRMAPLAVFLLWGYSYTKRFTPCCHLVLGCVHGLSLFFAWAAVTGSICPEIAPLAVAVMLSIAGMDIVYACQDFEFDRHYGLYSMPVALGCRRSLLLARGLHLLAVVNLWVGARLLHLPPPFYVGVLLAALVYLYYHRQVELSSPTQINRAFFGCNTAVGAVLLLSALGSAAWNVS